MSFRTRVFLALALAGVVPLALLALGIRREVDRRLTAEYRARVDGAVRNVRADLTRESTAIQGRLAVFFPGAYAQNHYRLLDARDGWNYLAVPITLHSAGGY